MPTWLVYDLNKILNILKILTYFTNFKGDLVTVNGIVKALTAETSYYYLKITISFFTFLLIYFIKLGLVELIETSVLMFYIFKPIQYKQWFHQQAKNLLLRKQKILNFQRVI
jgi:ABC-type Co2+ transport system permease subunit